MNLTYKDNFIKAMIGFVLFLFLLFAYLFKIDEDVKHYDQYHDWIVQLKLIDKELDSFIAQKLTFTNYDNINTKVDAFETIIVALQNSDMGSVFDIQLENDLVKLQSIYTEKIDLIEHSKSNNAQILNSIHYLFQLAEGIGNDPTLSTEVKRSVRDILFSLLQEFLNIHISSKVLDKKLEQLNRFESLENVKRLSYFSKHARSMLENIEQLESIHSESEQVLLSEKLIELHNKLDRGYKNKMLQQRIIALFAFISAFVFVVALIRIYSRSVRVKQRLLAFRSAVEHSDNSVVMTDADRNIVYVNEVFERDTGYKASEVIGLNPRILKSELVDQSYYDELNDALKKGVKWEGEFINRKKDGSLFHEKASIVPVYIENKLVNYLAIKLDITKYVEQQKEMDFLAYHDPLTRLPNRTFFEERLEQVLAISKRKGTRAAILFIDLDRFKVINDTLGHHIGDEMLKTVATRIKSVLRKGDTLARLGGDEFVVILEMLKEDNEPAYVSNKILATIREPIMVEAYTLTTTASIGIAIFPDDGDEMHTVIKHADSAMYEAKKLGKDRYHYYQEELSANSHFRLKIEQYLRTAIENSEFFLYYQPQYDLKSQKVIGLEALIRWENSELGRIGPDEFIPVAEETGLIIDIGEFVFREACETFVALQKSGTYIDTIAINVSSVQIRQNNFLERIKEIIDTTGIAAHHIEIEITERYLMEYTESSLTVLDDLRNMGLKISIDDFGTGYSSMSYLKKLPIDTIKVDKSFIDEIASDKNDYEITKAIIALSTSLEYSVVAEGIETLEQEESLRELNCGIGQGYYFCRPLSKEKLWDFMAELN